MNQSSRWLKLDNAGKIFPATSSKHETGVFRFSCELNEPVQESVLQTALEKTLVKFPHFLYILRNGLFWYYLEPSELKPTCHEENTGVCSQLFYRNQRHLLFDVSYYHNRINLETYHALADGTGVMLFLKYLVCSYLSIVHPDTVRADLADEITPVSISSSTEDSFKKYYKKVAKKKGKKPRGVYHLTGTRTERYTVIEGLLPCSKVLALAKSYHATLTVFLCAVLILSIHQEMLLYKEKKPIVITVPVNLRQYFTSDTLRNFFGNIRVSYQFGHGPDDLQQIIRSLSESFSRELTEEHLSGIISGYMAVERNPAVKVIPLSVKNFFLKIARRSSDTGETIVVSNIGKTGLPQQILPYVHHMSVFASTTKLQACICTCGDTLSVGFSSSFEETDIQRNFFRILADMGIEPVIQSNSAD